MKQLIVTADDVALDRGMTDGAIKAHRHGIVTACSIVANGVELDHALEHLGDVPSLETGAHLALVEERALSDGSRMAASHREFLTGYATRRITLAWIERELRAQIELLLSRDVPLRFLNGHQHLHAFPPIFRLVTRLAIEYGIGYVRYPAEVRTRGSLLRRASVNVLGFLAKRGRAGVPERLAMNEATLGISEAGSFTSAKIISLLDDVGEGVFELVTHPGLSVKRYPHWRYGWDTETAALCDPAVRSALNERGIILITPSAVSLR